MGREGQGEFYGGGRLSREQLKKARQAKGMTQQAMADYLEKSLVYYQKIEAGDRTGDFTIWDDLEDLLGIHQRKLREIEGSHPDQGGNP